MGEAKGFARDGKRGAAVASLGYGRRVNFREQTKTELKASIRSAPTER